jgi:hypothetical protein
MGSRGGIRTRPPLIAGMAVPAHAQTPVDRPQLETPRPHSASIGDHFLPARTQLAHVGDKRIDPINV